MGKLTVLLDFDGVVHSYKSGWRGVDVITDPPVDKVDEAIQQLRKDYKVMIYSSRCRHAGGVEAVKKWLAEQNIKVDGVAREKVPALAIIDDRGITFEGSWDQEFIDKIKNFKPWYKR